MGKFLEEMLEKGRRTIGVFKWKLSVRHKSNLRDCLKRRQNSLLEVAVR